MESNVVFLHDLNWDGAMLRPLFGKRDLMNVEIRMLTRSRRISHLINLDRDGAVTRPALIVKVMMCLESVDLQSGMYYTLL